MTTNDDFGLGSTARNELIAQIPNAFWEDTGIPERAALHYIEDLREKCEVTQLLNLQAEQTLNSYREQLLRSFEDRSKLSDVYARMKVIAFSLGFLLIVAAIPLLTGTL